MVQNLGTLKIAVAIETNNSKNRRSKIYAFLQNTLKINEEKNPLYIQQFTKGKSEVVEIACATSPS